MTTTLGVLSCITGASWASVSFTIFLIGPNLISPFLSLSFQIGLGGAKFWQYLLLVSFLGMTVS